MRARDPSTGRFVKVSAVDLQPIEDKALTAAVAVLPENALDRMPRASEPWQERAVRLWRVLGVLHYPTSFMAEQVQRIGWNVEVDGNELEPEAAEKAMEAITAPMSVAEASRRLALNLEVLGEVYYYRKSDEWNVLAPTVAKRNEILRGADIRIREWIADFVESDKPDSPVRAALDIAEEIRVLSNLSRSQSRNRVAQRGILLIPKEGQFPENDPFKGTLEASMTAPIADEYSPSAVVPPVVEYPAEYIEKWTHLVLAYPYDEKLDAKIDNAIKRLALSLNMPPEVLLGNIDSSHWNAWLSEESTYRAHIEPLAVMVGEVYAKAMMEAVDGAVSVKVTPDPSELLARRQSVADAFKALELGVVGYDYVRRQIGADEADAPTPEEVELILLFTGKAPKVEVPAVGTGDTSPPQLPSGNGQAPSPVAPNGNGVTAAVGSDEAELDELARRLTDMDFRLLSVLQGLAEMSVIHARSVVDAGEIGAQEAVGTSVKQLAKAWSRELTQARKALKQVGIDASGEEWELAQDASVDLLTDEMTTFITQNLDKSDSEAPSLPVLTLRRVLATAGGSGSATVAAVSNPAPTFQDPQGFALGVLPLKELKKQDIQLINWKFRYGPLAREHPFLEHKAVDGQFMTSDGHTSQGWYPGDHGGCFAAGAVVEGPKPLATTLRYYEGTVIDLTLASGQFVTITPNHPVLTPQGWVPAGLLDEGGYVVGRFDSHRAASLVPDDYDAPSLIEDVVRSFNEPSRVVTARVPVAAEHFHGDGGSSEIAVVTTDRLLGDGRDVSLGEPGTHQLLGGVESTRDLPRLGDSDPLGFWLRGAALGSIGRERLTPSLLRSHARGFEDLSGRVAPRRDASLDESRADGSTGYAETVTEREFRLSGLVAADQVVKVERRDFVGHVYNLQTRSGWYVAGGVIVHNCECGMTPVFRKVKQPKAAPKGVGA